MGDSPLQMDLQRACRVRAWQNGNYTIRVVPQHGLETSSPVLGYNQVSLAHGAHARGFVFSEQPISST
jgi:hypothetical protein